MFPIICKIGPLTIYSYGLMLAIAVLVCARFMSREAKRDQILVEDIYDLIFWCVLGGILGGRIFFIFLNLDFFLQDLKEILMIQHGGLAWQGALTGGGLIGWLYIRRKQWPLGFILDLSAPYVALGQAIGRIGCFLNGCCYGREVAWGIYFPVHDARLHPTQLYSMAGLLLIFFILKEFRRISKVPGQVMVVYLILASLQRFVIEFFRADHEIFWAGMSIFQIVSIGILLFAVLLNIALVARYRRHQHR